MDTNVQEIWIEIKGKKILFDKEDEVKIKKYSWHLTNSGYARTNNRRGVRYMMHHLVLMPPKGFVIDHINGNKIDNRRVNLRTCTNSQNLSNRPAILGRKFKGVSWSEQRKKYEAKIMVNYKTIHLGRHTSELDAAAAYNEAALKYFGEFAYLNKV